MIRIHVLGAAGGVTGSCYLVETSQARVMVDFGQFQGPDARGGANFVMPPDLGTLNAVVLTHAHLDHSGRLPILCRGGYKGKIYATSASSDLTDAVLADAAGIQEQDTFSENRRRERAGLDPIPPLFTRADADCINAQMHDCDYYKSIQVADGISVLFREAGHILGATSIEMTVTDGGVTKVIAFSGDIGPRDVPILRDPDPPAKADLVFLESTYGDREHPPMQPSIDQFLKIIRETIFNKQRVLIPAFAIGRTQLLLYYMGQAVRDGKLPPDIPIFLDSPAAMRATLVYRKHGELYDKDAAKLARTGNFEQDLKNFRIIESPAESRALNESWDPCVIIAGSGMAEGGRIVHHLRHNIWRRGTSLILVGYMGEGTMGRRLAEGAKQIYIFNDPIIVRANVYKIDGFSAHAGRAGLIEWMSKLAVGKPRVILTHGDNTPRASLAQGLLERYGLKAELPMRGDVLTLA
ncbi:MAG: MBL fold metallo-hydrolase RNA specificity domain-containing protein [Phycisphaerales bacterium]